MGLACGDIVLTVAVLSILITAPLGAFAIDCTYQRLLKKTDSAGRRVSFRARCSFLFYFSKKSVKIVDFGIVPGILKL